MGRHGDEERREVRRELISVSPFISFRLLVACDTACHRLYCVTRGQSDPGIDTDVGNPGLGGRNTIQGQIYYPSGRTLDKKSRDSNDERERRFFIDNVERQWFVRFPPPH